MFSFQEVSSKLHGSRAFQKILQDCLANEHYEEIIADYVGSNIVKPIWLYIYVASAAIQAQRVNLLKWREETILKVYQVCCLTFF